MAIYFREMILVLSFLRTFITLVKNSLRKVIGKVLFNYEQLTATISDKIFGTKWSNPVNLVCVFACFLTAIGKV